MESLWKIAERRVKKIHCKKGVSGKSTRVRAPKSASPDLFRLGRDDLGVPEDLGNPGGPRGLRRRVTQQVQGALWQFGGLRTGLLPRRQLLGQKLSHLGRKTQDQSGVGT